MCIRDKSRSTGSSMLKSTDRMRPLALLGAVAMLLLCAGCRNPFLPSSDIDLEWFQATYQSFGPSDEIVIYQSQTTGSTLTLGDWSAFTVFRIRNKVAATLT